ncbi:MgtC/SapB family protein [Leisingera sp. ANG-S]|uniref:MgtC/SapB family protein n=1 Tax=Leisingera sp. ANG-S TaxID=1577898 RepID=UPI0004923BBA|nr:MgtC/SapB family protein [Leisingera sp. ANG-S]
MDFFASAASHSTQLDWALRLTVALAGGALLGLDRELRHRRVGIRTYMMVSLGAAAFIIVGLEFGRQMQAEGLSSDPTRVTQGLMGAIGFIGAGAIIKGDKRVGGITTAASIWVSGAVGMAAGLGFTVMAFLTAGLAALLLSVSRLMAHRGADDRPDMN